MAKNTKAHKWRISVKRRNPFQNQLPDIQAKKQYLIRATEKSQKTRQTLCDQKPPINQSMSLKKKMFKGVSKE